MAFTWGREERFQELEDGLHLRAGKEVSGTGRWPSPEGRKRNFGKWKMAFT
jgi:hypothetical protein